MRKTSAPKATAARPAAARRVPTAKPITVVDPPAAQPPTSRLLTTWLHKRRIVLGIAIALAVLATSSLGVRAIVGRNVTIAGKVIDARTRQPVSGATVATEQVRRLTDATGAFRIPEVARGSAVRFGARNYRTAIANASADPISIKIRPIPVTGTVTSSFTGKGIPATVTGKAAQGTRPDGTFTAYGVGPGDALKVSAFGHAPASVPIGATRTVRVALKLGRVDPSQILISVEGFGYVNAPPEVIAETRNDMAAGDPEFGKHITGLAMKSVIRDADTVALAFAVALDPEYAALPGAREGFFEGLALGSGAKTNKDVTIGAVRTKRVTGDGFVGVAWQRYSAFVFLVGEKANHVDALARALILGGTTSTA